MILLALGIVYACPTMDGPTEWSIHSSIDAEFWVCNLAIRSSAGIAGHVLRLCCCVLEEGSSLRIIGQAQAATANCV